MTGMENAIEQAARVVNVAYTDYLTRGVAGTFGEHIARTLAEAGLLAVSVDMEVDETAAREWIAIPADQVHEEWTSASDGDAWTCCGNRDEDEVRQYALRQGHEVVRRYVTDWSPADGAEDDGRTE